MAYVTGTASSYANLLTAIQTALTANGWTNTSGVLSKGTTHVLLRAANPFSTGSQTNIIASIGNSSSGGALTGTPAPTAVRMGTFSNVVNSGDFVFPCTYRIFINTSPDEVYIYVNYNTDMYQWLAWGKSPTPGSSGNGTWLAGTFGALPTGTTTNVNSVLGAANAFYIANTGAAGSVNTTSAGLFMNSVSYSSLGGSNSQSIIHSGTAGDNGWSVFTNRSELPNAYEALGDLMRYSPNAWNGQSTLFKINISIPVGSNKVQMCGELAHARLIKINFIDVGSIITLGSDKWMIFPCFRKGSAELNGTGDTTGFFGHALRYDGP